MPDPAISASSLTSSPQATASTDEEVQLDEEELLEEEFLDEEFEEELIIEDFTIDGICGVY